MEKLILRKEAELTADAEQVRRNALEFISEIEREKLKIKRRKQPLKNIIDALR